ncbi:DUF1499 domain-containing protein [Sphingorhabdus sp. M41]|uniref:DUF1499 domain-containing protein n=1 Tax=Sphingorhabdus sp. M41 TaxID=1806885 RepID=UPI0009ECE5CD|nr:DUF1499 domain-containing protein [Sphingorhabdus sp. M41]
MADGKWTERLSKSALIFGIAAPLVAMAGVTLARYDMIGKLAGFSGILAGALIAIVAIITGAIALALAFRNGGSKKAALFGLLVALIYISFLGSRAAAGGDVPAIHDISTDLASPPQFVSLPLRADNLAGVDTVENWRAIHAKGYPDLQSITIAKPVAAVIADAERIAQELGWNVAVADPATGHFEATASVSYIRFKDDVVLRVVPTEDGASSIVDMRSVSRVGVSDLGVNAKRVRSFLDRLAKVSD